ncbi:MAG: AAA family ATPase [Clostridia bacterium]|nr:AAA family ATPase [Clostridia bacterium]
MNLSGLSLSGFRSYSSRSFEFDPKTNLIIGENGIGKTNL